MKKLKTGVDMLRFLNSVNKCTSDVLFQTSEGDCLNLKSTLSQYVFSLIDADDDLLKEGNVVCSDSDYIIIKEYLK